MGRHGGEGISRDPEAGIFSVGAVVTTVTLDLQAKAGRKGWLSASTYNAGRYQLPPEACPGSESLP